MTSEFDTTPERPSLEQIIVREMDILDKKIDSLVRAAIGDDAYIAAKMFEQLQKDTETTESEEQRLQRETFQAKAFMQDIIENPEIDSSELSLNDLDMLFRLSQNQTPDDPNLVAYQEARNDYVESASAIFAEQLADYKVVHITDGICTLDQPFTEHTDVRIPLKKTADADIEALVLLVHRGPAGEGVISYETLEGIEYFEYDVDLSKLIPRVARAYQAVNTLLRFPED